MIGFLLFASQVVCQRHGVIFCGSRSFYNYRHTADLYYQHHVLKESGFPMENLIVMCYDDIVDASQNPFKGQIFRSLDHRNVYPGKENVHYKGTDVSAEMFYKVLLGDDSHGPALKSTDQDDVFIFFDNHGGSGILGVPDGCGGYIYADKLRDVLQQMYDKKMYKNCFFPITACYSGSVGKVIGSVPKLYILTASNDHESSYACTYDRSLQTYLSSEFSTVMSLLMESDPECLLGDAFNRIKSGVKESEVCRYGDRTLEAFPFSKFIGDRKHAPSNSIQRPGLLKSKETQTIVDTLKMSLMRYNSEEEAAALKKELKAEKKLDRLVSALRAEFIKTDDLVRAPENINFPVYRKVLETVQKHCGYLSESFYDQTPLFAHLAGVADEAELVEAVKQYC